MANPESSVPLNGDLHTAEEADLLHRNRKNIRWGNSHKVSTNSWHVNYGDLYDNDKALVIRDDFSFKKALTREEDWESEGEYECPEFVLFSKKRAGSTRVSRKLS